MAHRIELPGSYDSAVATPIVLMSHPNNSTADSMFTGSYTQMVTAFKAAGFICAAADMGLNNWGSQSGVDDLVALYVEADAAYNLGAVCHFVGSMGGAPSLISIAQDAIPDVCCWCGIYPVCNLANSYAAGFASYIDLAYNIPAGGTYAAQTAGHDPMLHSAADFNALPFRFYASPADGTVLKSQHTDLMAAKVAATAPEATVVVTSGAHGDASNFQPADTVAFFQRSIAAFVSSTSPLPRLVKLDGQLVMM